MLFGNNTENVIKLTCYFDNLKNVDKIKLSLYLLQNKGFDTEYNISNIITVLNKILCKLDCNYDKNITNFSRYKNLLLLATKYLELSDIEKKKFSVEMLFNIYQTNFDNELLNYEIEQKLDVFDYSYALLDDKSVEFLQNNEIIYI